MNNGTVLIDPGVCPHSRAIRHMTHIRDCLLEPNRESYYHYKGGKSKQGYYHCPETCWREKWKQCPILQEKAPEETPT